MIEAKDLVVGSTYFALFYHDKALMIPDIKTFIFIGENIDSENDLSSDAWYFQDPESYLKYGASLTKPRHAECSLHKFDREMLFSVYDWRELIKELSENKTAQDEGRIFD